MDIISFKDSRLQGKRNYRLFAFAFVVVSVAILRKKFDVNFFYSSFGIYKDFFSIIPPALIVGYFLRSAFFEWKTLKRIQGPSTEGMAILTGGFFTVRGKVSGTRLFEAPVSRSPCVWYQLQFDQLSKATWRTCADYRLKSARFNIDDGNRDILITPDLMEPIYSAEHGDAEERMLSTSELGQYNQIMEIVRSHSDLKLGSTYFWNQPGKIRIIERKIETGQSISVFGKLIQTTDREECDIESSWVLRPLIVWDTAKHDYLIKTISHSIRFTFGIIVFVILGGSAYFYIS